MPCKILGLCARNPSKIHGIRAQLTSDRNPSKYPRRFPLRHARMPIYSIRGSDSSQRVRPTPSGSRTRRVCLALSAYVVDGDCCAGNAFLFHLHRRPPPSPRRTARLAPSRLSLGLTCSRAPPVGAPAPSSPLFPMTLGLRRPAPPPPSALVSLDPRHH
jgi:hypothetical protein